MPTSKHAQRGTPYQVLDYEGVESPPPLPDGHGAVRVFTWCRPVPRRISVGPLVGVDGKPAGHGYGRFLIVLPAGEHLIEIQSVRAMRTMRVTVEPGQIVPVEYAGAGDDYSAGAIGHGPQHAPGRSFSPGGYMFVIGGMVVAINGIVYGLALADRGSSRTTAIVTVTTVLLGILAGIGVYRFQQRQGRPADPYQDR